MLGYRWESLVLRRVVAVWSFFKAMPRMMGVGLGWTCIYQLSRKSNPVFRIELLVLNWENVGLPTSCAGSSCFSFSVLVETDGDLDRRLEENISSKVLLTEGSVLWDRSHPATVEETLTGGAGFEEMEMDAGVALTATGGCGAGGFGARCLVDFAGAGGGGGGGRWGSAGSGSFVTEVSCRR